MDRRSLLRASAGVGGLGLAAPSFASSASGEPACGGVAVTSGTWLSMQIRPLPYATGSVTLSYRLITPSGTVVFGSVTTQFAGGALMIDKNLQLPLQNGCLVGVMATPGNSPPILHGDVFVCCQIGNMALFQDYLQSGLYLGWPTGRQRSSVEGPGGLNPLNVPDPPAGQDWLQMIHGNTRWVLHSLIMTLTTSSVNRPRLVTFMLGYRLSAQFAATAPQPPATTVVYQLARGSDFVSIAPNWAGSPNQGYNLIPAGLPLPLLGHPSRGNSIGSRTYGLDAGDQWSAVGGIYEQWYQDST